MKMLKYFFAFFAVSLLTLLSGCNISTFPVVYCPQTVNHVVSSRCSVKVGKIADDRCGDARKIGEINPSQSVAPDIYYSKRPVSYVVRTATYDSLVHNGYRVTQVHPDRILTGTITKIETVQYGKNVTGKAIYCSISIDFSLLDPSTDKTVWHQTIKGESSVDFSSNEKNAVKMAFTNALGDAMAQLQTSPSFNRALGAEDY